MSSGRNRHSRDLTVDRAFTTVNIYGNIRNNNPVSTRHGALVVHNGDVGFNNDLRVSGTVYANTFEGNIATVFDTFQLVNGDQAEAYVITSDSSGLGTWKTPHWFTNDTPVNNTGPTDNNIWTEHNVGLGITAPSTKLHINVDTVGDGAIIGNAFVGNWAGNSNYGILGHRLERTNAGGYAIKLLNTGETQFNSVNQLQLRISDVPAVTVSNIRYVGIGTDQPSEQLHITENALIEGNLEVLGNTTTINTETLTIEDNMIKLSSNNISDNVDFGFYGLYVDNGVTKFSGLYRDASEHDSLYKLFTNSTTEPSSTVSSSDLAILRLNGLETEVGITFDASSRLNHNELILSGGSNPYTDQVVFKPDGKVGIGTLNPNVMLEVIGDVNTEGNLGIGISLPNPNYSIDTDRTDAYRIPSGTNAQRPSPIKGLFRFNDQTQIFEGYYDNGLGDAGWRTVGIVTDSDVDTFIEPELLTDDDHIRIFTEVGNPNPKDGEALTVTDYSTSNAQNVTGLNNRSVGIGVSQPYVKLQIEGTDAIKIPVGNDAERPITLEDGLIRYNSTSQLYEGYSTKYNQWESLLHIRDGDKDTYITPEDTVDDDCLKFYTQNELRMVVKGDYTMGGDITEPRIGIGVTSADPIYPLEIRSSQAMLIPAGNNGERPINPEFGLLRYNYDRYHFEGYGQTHLGWARWNRLQDPLVDMDGDTEVTVEALPDEDKIRFRTAGDTRMIVMPTGDVGIGISIPRAKLDVIGSAIITGDTEIGGNTVISGDLTVHGNTFQANTENLLVEDPLIKLATNNPSDSLDIGFYGLYDGLGVTKFTGLVRDASDGYYTLFENLQTDPATNLVNFADIGITRADLRVDIIDANFIDFPGSEIRVRSSGANDKFIMTETGFLGVGVYPQYPLHVLTTNDQNWSVRIKNDIGTDIFMANTEGQGMMINTHVTSTNGNYAFLLANTTYGSNNPLLTIKNSGRVGIHTATLDNLVNIHTTTAGQGITVGDNTSSLGRGYFGLYDTSTAYISLGNIGGSLTHTTDYALRQGTSGDTIINAATGQNIEFRHNNVGQVYIDTSGNVGIGSGTPLANLDVVGDVQILDNIAAFALRVDNSATSVDIAHNDGSGILIDSSGSYAFKAINGLTNNFIVTNSGLVGINTDSPSEKLDIITTTLGEGAKIGYVQIGNHITDTNRATFAHSNIYDEPDSYALRQNELGKTEINSKLGQNICFKIDDDQRAVIDSNGNFGLGVTSPTNRLDVLGDTKLDGNVVVTGTLSFEGPFVESLTFQDNLLKLAGDNTGNAIDIGFYGCYVEAATTKYAGWFWDVSTTTWRSFHGLESEPGTTVDILGTGYTPSKVTVADAYVINKLGVGIETPSFEIDVNGEVRADNYVTTSDERTKNVMGTVDARESYEKIKNLEVYKYTLKKDRSNTPKVGFIAQQLEQSMPEATITSNKIINGEQVEDFKGIDQYAIIANLTNALKYTINKIEELEEEIRVLKIKDSLSQINY